MKTATQFATILLLVAFGGSCNVDPIVTKVHNAVGTLPDFPKIDVTEPERFLNDLMLCPFWKVERARNGSFVARPRSLGPRWPSDGERVFLFDVMAREDKSLPKDYRIYNAGLGGHETFSSFGVTVVFEKSDLTNSTLGEAGQDTSLGVYDSYHTKIGSNSSSSLVIKLSTQHDIYVFLREHGADPKRTATFATVTPVMQELARIAGSSKTYRTEERYSAFFNLFFTPPLEDQKIKRLPESQGRDTFCGYFRSKPDTSYAGVNIKISQPVYCQGEGTRRSSRLQKAEYLGAPYHEGDLMFFLIEDNAVFVSDEYIQNFGWYSGNESFEGALEVLNDRDTVLLTANDKFTGWER